MKILKYFAIDFVSTMCIVFLGALFQSFIGAPLSNYIFLAGVCFFVGLFFSNGTFHGVSISSEVLLLLLAILFMIGQPMSSPLSGVLKQEIILPLLPLVPLGLLAGFVGNKVKQKYREKKAKAIR